MLILEKLRNLQMEEEPWDFSTLIVHHLPRNPSIQKRFESSNVNKLWNSKLPEAGAKEPFGDTHVFTGFPFGSLMLSS